MVLAVYGSLSEQGDDAKLWILLTWRPAWQTIHVCTDAVTHSTRSIRPVVIPPFGFLMKTQIR